MNVVACFLCLAGLGLGTGIPLVAHAAPACAATIGELRSVLADQRFALKWRETGMDDGKPLVMTLLEKAGVLFIEFVKTDEGLWAEGAGIVCRNGDEFEIRFEAGKVRLGPAANWAVRYTFTHGGQFTLTRIGVKQMQIATLGWSGMFASEPH